MFFNNIEKKILFRSLEEKSEIENRIDKINLHSITDLRFLDQFLIYIFLDENHTYFFIRLYKKTYNIEEKKWEKKDLIYLASWKLTFNLPDDNIYNIDNIEDKNYIQNNNIDLDSLDFQVYYPYDILEAEYEVYNENKYTRINIDEDFETQTLSSSWGFELNYKDIRWMTNLENYINCNYGGDTDFLFKLRCKSWSDNLP